jgi:hypothetical protein
MITQLYDLKTYLDLPKTIKEADNQETFDKLCETIGAARKK